MRRLSAGVLLLIASAIHAVAQQHPPEPAYIGSAACSACHEEASAAWQGSMHELAWQEPTETSVLGDFNDAVFEHRGVVTRFTREGAGFAIETEGSDGVAHRFSVVGVAGIAPLQQYLLETQPGRLQSFDVAWDVGARRWYHLYPEADLPPGDGLHWTGPYKNWNARCAECHATGYAKNYSPATRRYDSVQAEIGVGCEACHGPGEAHRAWATEPGAYDTARWPGLGATGLTVAFTDVPARTEIEQCAGCHSLRETFAGESPLPGTPFHDAYRLALLSRGLYHADGSINDEVYVYGSFLQSKMHAQGVRCTDCHDPHRAAVKPDPAPVCVQCHSPAGNPRFPTLKLADFESPSHHFHASGSEGAQCVSCHMPERIYMGIDGRRDHAFRIPRPELAAETGAPDACTGCHRDRDPGWAAAEIFRRFPGRASTGRHFSQVFAAAWRDPRPLAGELLALAEHRDLPGIVRASALDLLEQTGDLASIQSAASLVRDPDPLVREAAVDAARALPVGDRVRITAAALEDPVRSVRIAAARAFLTVPASELPARTSDLMRTAMTEWQASLAANADFPETQLAIGGAAIALRNVEASVAAFREAVALDPQLVQGWMMIVRILAVTGNLAGARQALDSAIAANPENSPLRQLGATLQQ